MSDLWPPSIDPLQELYVHGQTLKKQEQSLINIATAINQQAAAIEKLSHHNQYLLGELRKLQKQLAELK